LKIVVPSGEWKFGILSVKRWKAD